MVKGKSAAGPRGDQVVLADWIVGEIVSTLDKLGISQNTLIIFTSDNGPRQGVNGHKSAMDLRGYKGSIWEGGHRVPFVAKWPDRIKPGLVSDELLTLTDLLGTTAAIIGKELPDEAGEDSYNILPALLGKQLEEPIHDVAIHHSGGGVFGIRRGDWKLIDESEEAGYDNPPKAGTPGQLYNLSDDPWEQMNLYHEKPEIVAQLKDKNIGILITDHNVQETLAITERSYLMFEGGILKSGIPEDLAEDEMVRKVYLGQNFELRKKKLDF